jgi:hypothetical protein
VSAATSSPPEDVVSSSITDIVVGLDTVVEAFETDSKAASVVETKELAHKVVDAIPAYLGEDAYIAEDNMEALGAPGTCVIEKLVKFLKALLPAVSSPSEPSYEVATEILLNLLVTIRSLMSYTVSGHRTALCFNNRRRIGDSGVFSPLVSIMQIYHQRQLELQLQAGRSEGSSLRVLIECCRLLSETYSDSTEHYVKIKGSVQVLVDILKTHGLRNAEIALAASKAVERLVSNRDNRRWFADVPGSLESLVNVLNAHDHSNDDVAKTCLWVIRLLANNDAVIRDKFGSTEVFSAIVDALKCGKETVYVSPAILSLCQDNPANIAKFNALNAYDALEVKAYPSRDRHLALKALRGDKP